ncbi:MAG TPA: 5-formyltetrahydrofolate cyclo-ligase, partial [Elusimicrobiota bacterium]|nr:5-formyltetrahydrofolate cyclo-ligase [Elusimicrobiota bacterium]
GGRDLLVVPGTAFTPVGDRLGAGGGYFDRFLARSSVQTAALAFPEQIATRLPARPHDRRVGVVVTANRTYTP